MSLKAKSPNLLNQIQFNDAFKHNLEEIMIKKYRSREEEAIGTAIAAAENVTELKKQQKGLLADHNATTSTVVKRLIEEEIEGLEQRIQQSSIVRNKCEVAESDIKAFVRSVMEFVEHPMKMLGNNQYPYSQRALFELVFEEPPTYQQMVSRTPKLAFIFKLSGNLENAKSSLVTLEDLEWNTVQSMIMRWNKVFDGIGHSI